MMDSLIELRRIDEHRIGCALSSDARVRVWTIGNVVEVSNPQGKVTSLDGVVTMDGTRANTSHLYLVAAQFQQLPVEYIEDTWQGAEQEG